MIEISSTRQVEEILRDGTNEGIFLKKPRLSERKQIKIKTLKDQDVTLTNSFEKLTNYFKQDLGNFTEKEANFLLFWNSINLLTYNIEILKVFFYHILDKQKIIFSKPNPEYGRLLAEICQKLRYSKEKKKTIWDILYVNFRNAIAHQDFEIKIDRVIVTFENGKKKNYNVTKLNEAINDVKSIHNSFEEYFRNLELILEKKLKQVNEEWLDKLNQLECVKKKTNEQRIANAQQKQKLSYLKNMESRGNRKITKLDRKQELLDRKKKRRKKKTAKIVKPENVFSSYRTPQDSEQ